tara:strand:- start:345 stop:776 length:432 start_codon:yes stop_codon:yes gene_type:complete
MTKTFEELKQKALDGEMDNDAEGSVALMCEVGKLSKRERWEITRITYDRLSPKEKLKELGREYRMRSQYFNDLMDWEPNGKVNFAIKEATERLEDKHWEVNETLYLFARRIRDFVLESNYIYTIKNQYDWYLDKEETELKGEL